MKKISLFICSLFLCFVLLACDDSTTTDPTDVKVSEQCLGITQSGERCQRMTTNKCGYCWQHVDQSPTDCD